MDFRETVMHIEMFRSVEKEVEPHGRAHQIADLYLAEARELAAQHEADRDPGRVRRLKAWATANGIPC